MKTTLIMNFKLTNGKATTLSLTYPREDLTEAEVKKVADTMIAKNFLTIGESSLASLDKVFVRKVEETKLP
ncbi:DUF2922 domain-containing protein [Selenomonas sp. AE3005]|jgi:serine/threonine protein kinase HipA of HipAB toxin-antitoxin module|uniref:DUF2922 domain-containing protein n=1 Tax=Selenomonas sp. AE3005 TaxID=1485543 RepID=UPI00048610B9|nr:DUF2922 domain-containing protein [Selenomonas sp. AE3005]